MSTMYEITEKQWKEIQDLFDNKNKKIKELEEECDKIHSENVAIEKKYTDIKKKYESMKEETHKLNRNILKLEELLNIQDNTMGIVLKKLNDTLNTKQHKQHKQHVRISVDDLFYNVEKI